MNLKSTVRELQFTPSRDIVISAIACQLQALGAIPKSINLMDVVDIRFDDTKGDPLKLTLILKEEADVIYHNG